MKTHDQHFINGAWTSLSVAMLEVRDAATEEVIARVPAGTPDDVDVAVRAARAVRATVNSCFLNTGQTRIALTHLLIRESHYQQAERLAVETARSVAPGDPTHADTRPGPLISTRPSAATCSPGAAANSESTASRIFWS